MAGYYMHFADEFRPIAVKPGTACLNAAVGGFGGAFVEDVVKMNGVPTRPARRERGAGQAHVHAQRRARHPRPHLDERKTDRSCACDRPATWSVDRFFGPLFSTAAELTSVKCTTSTSCAAVGWVLVNGALSVLVEQSDGTNWTLASAANPANAVDSELLGVAWPTTTDCHAVGVFEQRTDNTTQNTLAEHLS